MKRINYGLIVTLLLASSASFASMPVIDLSAIAQAIKLYQEVKAQYKELQNLSKTNIK